MSIKTFSRSIRATCEKIILYIHVGGMDLEMLYFSGRLYDLDEEEESLIEVSR